MFGYTYHPWSLNTGAGVDFGRKEMLLEPSKKAF
jgi:hypothetical protein